MSSEMPQGGQEQQEPSSGEQLGKQLSQIHEQAQQVKPEIKRGKVRRFFHNAAVVAGIGLIGGGAAEVATHHQEKPETTPTPTTAPETPGPVQTQEVASGFHFNSGEAENVAKVANAEPLRDHMQITKRIAVGENLNFTEISVDDAKPSVDVYDFDFARQVASELTSKRMNVNYQYSPENQPKTVAFEVKPRAASERYVVYVPESMDLAQFDPNVAQSSHNSEAFTKCTEAACVTIIKSSPETVQANANVKIGQDRINALTEAFQSSIEVTGGASDTERTLGQDNISAGLGTALAFAENQVGYSDYQNYVKTQRLGEDQETGAHIYEVDQATYQQMHNRMYQ